MLLLYYKEIFFGGTIPFLQTLNLTFNEEKQTEKLTKKINRNC